jgi:hypothetical protein
MRTDTEIKGDRQMDNYSEILYARPSSLEGVARTLDIGGVFDSYNPSRTPEEADRLATASDWFAVGSDLRRAAERFGRKYVHRSTR